MKNETVVKKKVDVSSFALYIGAVLILICFTIVCKIAGKDFLTLRKNRRRLHLCLQRLRLRRCSQHQPPKDGCCCL